MSGGGVLLVCGSRLFEDAPERVRAWAHQRLHLQLHGDQCPETLVVGDARGIDAWAAASWDGDLVVVGRDGWVTRWHGPLERSVVEVRWTSAPPPADGDRAAWRERLLSRDRVMVRWLARQPRPRRAVGIIHPGSRTRGSQYTLQQAELAGIESVQELVCPRELLIDGGGHRGA